MDNIWESRRSLDVVTGMKERMIT